MPQKLINHSGKSFFSLPTLFALILYGGLTIPALFGSHFLFNLEPYPDGLYYVGQSLSLIKGQGLVLSYYESQINSVVPPGYSLFLSLFYIFNQWAAMFYIANLVAGGMTIIILGKIIQKISDDWRLQTMVLGMYLSHAYIMWLPGLPMAENVALMIVSLSIWLLMQARVNWKQTVGLLGLAGWLVLSKYAYVPIAMGLGMLLLVRLARHKKWLTLGGVLVIGAVVTIGFLWWLNSRGLNPFSTFSPQQFGRASASGLTYYSFVHVIPNARAYVGGLLSQPAAFLWLSVPLSSWAVTLLSIWGVGAGLKAEREAVKRLSRIVLSLLIAGCPLFLLFYVHDSRYLIFVTLYWSLGVGLWFVQFPWPHFRWWLMAATVIIHVFAQAPLYKSILANNWGHRSVAWQYQAIRTFDTTQLADGNAQLITALPPFLVNLYQEKPYRVLPLSTHQEFINKGQYVWGTPPSSSDLLEEYARQLQLGQRLVITNAYITHNPDVIEDFERYKQRFALKPLAAGCSQTCDLFELTLPDPVIEQSL